MLNFALGRRTLFSRTKNFHEPDIAVERRAHRGDELAYKPACSICLADFENLLADHWATFKRARNRPKPRGLFKGERSRRSRRPLSYSAHDRIETERAPALARLGGGLLSLSRTHLEPLERGGSPVSCSEENNAASQVALLRRAWRESRPAVPSNGDAFGPPPHRRPGMSPR